MRSYESTDLEILSSCDDDSAIYDRLTAINSAEGKIVENPHVILRRRDSAGEAAEALKKDLEDLGYDLECNSFITKKEKGSSMMIAERYQHPVPPQGWGGILARFSQDSSMSSKQLQDVDDPILAMRSLTTPVYEITNPPRFEKAVFDEWNVEDDWDAACVVPRTPSVKKIDKSLAVVKAKIDHKKEKNVEEELDDDTTDDEEVDQHVERPPQMRKAKANDRPPLPSQSDSSSHEDKDNATPMIIEGLSFVKSTEAAEDNLSPRAKRARAKLRLLVETRQQQVADFGNEVRSAQTAPAKAMSTPPGERTLLVADQVNTDNAGSDTNEPVRSGLSKYSTNVGSIAVNQQTPAVDGVSKIVPPDSSSDTDNKLQFSELTQSDDIVEAEAIASSSDEATIAKRNVKKAPKKKRFVTFNLFNRNKSGKEKKKAVQEKDESVIVEGTAPTLENERDAVMQQDETKTEEPTAADCLSEAVSSNLDIIASSLSHLDFSEDQPKQTVQKKSKVETQRSGCHTTNTGKKNKASPSFVDYEIETIEGVEVVNLGKSLTALPPDTPDTAVPASSPRREGNDSAKQQLPCKQGSKKESEKWSADETELVASDMVATAWGSLGKVLGVAGPEPVGADKNALHQAGDDVAEFAQEAMPEQADVNATVKAKAKTKAKAKNFMAAAKRELKGRKNTAATTEVENANKPFFPSLDSQHVVGPPSGPKEDSSPIRSVNSPTKQLRDNLRNRFKKFRATKKPDGLDPNLGDPRDRVQDFLDSKLIGQEEHSYPSKMPKGREPTEQYRETLSNVPSHLILNKSPKTGKSTPDGTVASPSKLDARIWDEIAHASSVVESAMKKLEPAQKDAPPEIQSVMSDEIERALLTLKKHADRFGVTESDLLLAVKSQDDSQSKGDNQTAVESEVSTITEKTMTIGQEILDVFKTYFDAK